jgi:hypothetical protein
MDGGLYRTQILLDKKQHAVLAALAQQENRSLSDKVREIINRYLTEQDAEEQLNRELNALGNLKRIREQTALAYGVYAGDLIAYDSIRVIVFSISSIHILHDHR